MESTRWICRYESQLKGPEVWRGCDKVTTQARTFDERRVKKRERESHWIGHVVIYVQLEVIMMCCGGRRKTLVHSLHSYDIDSMWSRRQSPDKVKTLFDNGDDGAMGSNTCLLSQPSFLSCLDIAARGKTEYWSCDNMNTASSDGKRFLAELNVWLGRAFLISLIVKA